MLAVVVFCQLEQYLLVGFGDAVDEGGVFVGSEGYCRGDT